MHLPKRRPITYIWARRIAISIVGGTVLLLGVAMLVLPGPGLLVIPLGLAILGVEYAWARLWLRRVKTRTSDVIDVIRRNSPFGRNNDRH
ncbi:MAG TPA: PGPGW domain-containing protein [Steroidobacteraceae bacterium]